MRRALLAVGFSCLTLTTIARGAEEERVTTRNGTVVQGELVEKSPGRKLVLKLATGEIRNIPWDDIVPSAGSRPKDADLVHTADGGAVQGKLVEMVPRDHWTLKLGTGEVRKVPWSDIVDDRPAPPEPLLPAVPPLEARARMPPSASAKSLPSTPMAHVTVTSDVSGVMLEGVDQPVAACEAPCYAVVAPGSYRLSGARTSPSFRLEAGASTVDMHAGAGARTAGVSLVIVGVLGVLGAGGLLAGAYAAPDETIVYSGGRASTTSSPQPGLLAGGIIAGAVGVVALAIGIPVWALTPTPRTTLNGNLVPAAGNER